MSSWCRASWPSPTTTLDRKRTKKGRHDVWWVEGFSLCFSSVLGWIGIAVWVNVFTMPFLRADSGPWRSTSEEHLPSFLTVAHHYTGQEGEKWTKTSCLVSWVFCSLFVLGMCIGGWEWMCEWMSLWCHSCSQILDRGDRCLGPDLQCPR